MGDAHEGWWVVEASRDIGRRPRSITRHGRRLVLWRDGSGGLHAHDAQCPHRGVDLGAGGRVVGDALECPYHGFRFDRAGACVAMPCEGTRKRAPDAMRIARHPVREERDFVWVFFGAPRDERDLPPLPGTPAMHRGAGGTCVRAMTWSVPLSRVMEAMLDLHHLPFAHRALSPGFGARLDPWRVRRAADSVHAEGWMRHGDGPWDGRSGQRFELEACPPGLVRLTFSPRMVGVIACTPVDPHTTRIVVRFEVAVPVIGSLLAWLALTTELALVQPDDERMQRLTLRRSEDLSECTLVRADAAIVEWHRLAGTPLRPSRRDAAVALEQHPVEVRVGGDAVVEHPRLPVARDDVG